MLKSIRNTFVLVIASMASQAVLADHSPSHSPYYSVKAEQQAIEFAPGIISTKAHFEINTVLNKKGDHVVFSRCSDYFKHCTLMESTFKDTQWGEPKALPISGDYLDADPYYNEDYSALYFISTRPITAGGEVSATVNLWRTNFVDGKWHSAEYLPELSSDADDLYPSITTNGDLYFPSFRNDDRKMYVAKANDNGFDKPVALPTDMFGEGAKIGDSVVLRDGKTIIFSMRRKDSQGKGDLYISYKKNEKWSLAKTLGDKVNTTDHEFTPIVSPDGKYLFFTRIEQGRGNLYQIKLSALGVNL